MKEMILVRHAKSSWSDPSLTDRERPLNKRGRRDAPVMAERLAETEAGVERLVTNPAKRARLTAEAFIETMRLEQDEVAIDEQLYMADEQDWMEVVGSQPDYLSAVAFVSHNPGLTGFLNLYLDDPLDNVPTCGVARLRFEVGGWDEIEEAMPVQVLYSIPKREGWEELE